ncbi:hypothetical protein TPB0596_42160 [Tsukamurella pulmonis]|nr:hypothetical protein TPB0596_42160 [Tsukamurella pulmonis]
MTRLDTNSRFALAALVCAVLTVALCACGAGPSTEAAPSTGPAGAFCVPEGFRTRYLNAPAPELGLEETAIAARNLVSSALTRGPDGGCWVSDREMSDDPCITDSLLERANTAPKSDRPQVVREIEADLRFTRDREHRQCYARGVYEGNAGGDHATVPDTGGVPPNEVPGSVGGSVAPTRTQLDEALDAIHGRPSAPSAPSTWNGPLATPDHGSMDAGGTETVADDPGQGEP